MTRLDLELVRRGLARSRNHARELIGRGAVRVNAAAAVRAAVDVSAADTVEADVDPYVSRAARKLRGALDDLGLALTGRALDAGASTGGFTQVLLECGCRPVYAVDVGVGQLAPVVRDDARVRVWERTNLRDLDLAHVDGVPVDVVVADVSFISLTLLVQRLAAVLGHEGVMLLMVKPQFEVGRELLGKGGVVHSAALQQAAVDGVLAASAAYGWFAHRVVPSRVVGPAGNQEHFALLRSCPP